jgi:hypothetical protein
MRRAVRERKIKHKRSQHEGAATADRTVKGKHGRPQYARKQHNTVARPPTQRCAKAPRRARKMGSTAQT